MILITAALCMGQSGCDEAQVASHNISKEADNFGIQRRIVFLNGITDQYLLTIEGRCSIYDDGNQLEVTCKTGEDDYKKHFLGLSDNVSYFAEQIGGVGVSGWQYKVIFRPTTLIPDFDVR